jgi:drug/metabolite transporter (DMT)-like permease
MHLKMLQQNYIPYLLMLLGVFFLATDVIIGKIADRHQIAPFGLGFWRVLGPAILLTPFYYQEIYIKRHIVIENWKILSILGLCISVLGGSALYLGVSLTTAINSGVVMTSQTAVMALLGWLFFRDQISITQTIGILIAALGVLEVVGRGNFSFLLGLQIQIGDFLVFAAVIGYSSYVVLLRASPSQLSPFARLCVVCWIGSILAAPLYVWEIFYSVPFAYTLTSLAMVLWISIIVSILALGFMTIGTLAVGSYIAGMFFYLRTVFIVGLAIIILGESIAMYHIVGVILIFTGIYMMSASRQK